MLGIVFALVSAGWFGVSTIAERRGVAGGSAMQGLYLTVIGGVPFFLLAAVLSGQLFDAAALDGKRYAALAVAGVVHFLYARYCMYRAYADIGANRALTVNQSTTLLAVLIAVALLNETVTVRMGIGIALVLIGPAIAASASSTPRVPAGGSSGAEIPTRIASGYVWAALGTLGFGTSPVLTRYALEGTSLGVLGGLVAYATAALLLLPLLARPGELLALRNLGPSTRGWFMAGTFTLFLGHMFRFVALGLAPVSIVIPLLRAQVILALALGYLVNRRYESFDRRVLVGIAVALVGSIVLVI